MSIDVARVNYVWVIDGVPTLFVTDDSLNDSYAVAQGFVDAHPGLIPPDGLAAKVNLRRLTPDTTTVTIRVDDRLDTLDSLFGTSATEAEDLTFSLEAGGLAPSSLFGKHVGLEAIGAAGERRRYSAVPGFEIGLRHLGANEAFANDADAAPVSDTPVLWVGRRCAIYRVLEVDGVWQDLADATRIWWGTLRGNGTQAKRVWSFACKGPESWAEGNLGTGNFSEPVRAVPLFTLLDDGQNGETILKASLQIVRLDQPDEPAHHTYVLDLTDDTLLVGASSYDDVVSAIDSFLDTVISDNGSGSSFDQNGNDIRYSTSPGNDGVVIRWFRGDTLADGDPNVDSGDSARLTVRFKLTLHERVWRILGYDPLVQTRDRDPLSPQYGQFTHDISPPDYWQTVFWSARPPAIKAFEDQDFLGGELTEDDFSGGGHDRLWPTLYSGGSVTFSQSPGQEFQLQTPEVLRIEGSLSRPLIADPDDEDAAFTLGGGVGLVNRHGVLVFTGPYRRRFDADQAEPAAGFAFPLERERAEGRTVQVARVCWRDQGAGVVTDTDGWARFVVYEWLEPRLVGFDYARFQGTWGGFRDPPGDAEPIRARPLVVWDYGNQGDKFTTVLQRILLTTGTGGSWFKDGALTQPLFGLAGEESFFDVGDNDSGGTVPKDAEVFAMGLGIPAEMVADPPTFDALPNAVGANLSRSKVVTAAPISASELIERLLGPTGVCLGFTGGKFTPFDPWKFPTPLEAALEITQELYAGKPGGGADIVPSQGLRKWAPIDRIRLRARVEPLEGDYARVADRPATDFGAPYRAQQILHRIDGDHLIHPNLQGVVGAAWANDLVKRWRAGFAFWAAAHSVVPVTLHMADAVGVWPGDAVLISDPWLLDTLGSYGVSGATGYVISRVASPKAETVALEILMGAETDYRMYAPSAVVTEYDEGDPFRLLCEDDHFGDRPSGTFDVDGFVEPSFSVEGGDADIEIFQFDGVTWSGGIFGTVESVNGEAANSFITLTGPLTGATWLSDHHSVVVFRDFANQGAAWVKRWFAPISNPDGTHPPASTPGVKWRGL